MNNLLRKCSLREDQEGPRRVRQMAPSDSRRILPAGVSPPWPGAAWHPFLRLLLLAVFVPFMLLATAFAANPIVLENQQPGTGNWQLGRPGFHTSFDDTGQIKGYASASSVNKGESITFYVSVNPAQSYTIDVYRVGWYGGAGGRLLQHVGPLSGANSLPARSTPRLA
jgi:hypothetical protein